MVYRENICYSYKYLLEPNYFEGFLNLFLSDTLVYLSTLVQFQELQVDMAGKMAQKKLNCQEGISILHWTLYHWTCFHLQTFQICSDVNCRGMRFPTGFHSCLFHVLLESIKSNNVGKTKSEQRTISKYGLIPTNHIT